MSLTHAHSLTSFQCSHGSGLVVASRAINQLLLFFFCCSIFVWLLFELHLFCWETSRYHWRLAKVYTGDIASSEEWTHAFMSLGRHSTSWQISHWTQAVLVLAWWSSSSCPVFVHVFVYLVYSHGYCLRPVTIWRLLLIKEIRICTRRMLTLIGQARLSH